METVSPTTIPGLYKLERQTVTDERGFFREVFRLDELEAKRGKEFKPVQMNHSLSRPGVIRALHAENWNKLVYPVTGTMFAAVADIRPESPTFGRVQTFTFSDEDRYALFVSLGLANSICAVAAVVNYVYLVDAYYTGKDVRAVAWDDPDLGINWPVKKPILSERDRHNPGLRELFPDKFK